jgi:hypothetical protein
LRVWGRDEHMQTEGAVRHEIAVLHPMHLGEILDRTFEIYRKNFMLFAGIAALPATMMLGLHCADLRWWHTDRWAGQLDPGGAVVSSWVVAFGYSHISGFLAALFLPAFVRAGGKALFGEAVSIGDSLRFAAARWREYLWIAILKLTIELFGPEALALGILAGTGFVLDKLNMMTDFPLFGVVGLLAIAGMFLLIFWVGAWISLAVPASAIEGRSGFKAVRRSWTLTKDSRWRIFITWIAVLICSLALQGGIRYVIRWAAFLFYRSVHYAGFNRDVYTALIYFFYVIVYAVIGPLYPIALTLFYYDQRVRREGYDVEKMLEAAGLEPGTDQRGDDVLNPGHIAGIEGQREPLTNRFLKRIRGLRGFS